MDRKNSYANATQRHFEWGSTTTKTYQKNTQKINLTALLSKKLLNIQQYSRFVLQPIRLILCQIDFATKIPQQMRITLQLSHRSRHLTLPVNINHLVSSLIYNIVANSSSEFAERLHEQGYRLEKRTFKLFTFSPLIPAGHRRWRMNGDGTMTTDAQSVSLLISSGKAEFVEHLVVGLLHQPLVQIGAQRFRVETVKKLDPPELGDDMACIMMSPLVCSTKRDGEKYPRFLLPNDEEFERVLLENLLGKYETLHQHAFEEEAELRFEVPEAYMARRQGKITKLITLKEGSPDETKVRGTLAPFQLRVARPLMEVGYYCGFGGLNAQGFGMVKMSNLTS